eukprot:2980695-Rhodomonas_salina.1
MAYFDERTKAEKEAAKNKTVDDDGRHPPSLLRFLLPQHHVQQRVIVVAAPMCRTQSSGCLTFHNGA